MRIEHQEEGEWWLVISHEDLHYELPNDRVRIIYSRRTPNGGYEKDNMDVPITLLESVLEKQGENE